MRRIFIAIRVPLSDSLESICRDARMQLSDLPIKWVEPANIHLTLAFLGNMDDSQVESVTGIMQKVVSRHEPFLLEISGVGTFGRRGDTRVIWIGTGQHPELISLQADMASALSAAGLFDDSGKFSPHITIGRPRRSARGREAELSAELRGRRSDSVEVKDIVLFESDLTGRTPVYTVIHRSMLGKG